MPTIYIFFILGLQTRKHNLLIYVNRFKEGVKDKHNGQPLEKWVKIIYQCNFAPM